MGLCAPGKRDALLSWPGHCYPIESGDAWPESLIIDALLRRANVFSVIGRRLSHVKLLIEDDRIGEAKAYLGFGALWFRVREDRPGQVE
jgi:hypothetical protein